MTKEKALITALKIIDTCNNHINNCLECPFNFKGCIVTEGNDIPIDWKAANIVELINKEDEG